MAGDEVSDYDKEVDGLAAAIQGGSWFKTSEIETVSTAAKGIAAAMTDYYRAGRLKELIDTADPHLTVVINSMERIRQSFVEDAQIEIDAIKLHYEGKQPAWLAKKWMATETREVQKRKAALVAYKKVLADIRDGHNKLSGSTVDITDKKVLSATYKRAVDLLKALKAVYELR